MHIASDTSLRHSANTFAQSPAALLHEERGGSQTIIGVPFESARSLRSMLSRGDAANDLPARAQRLFTIRAANSFGQRSSASILINRMYATRGYRCTGLPTQATPDKITLTACEHDEVMGTITVGFDAPHGLAVDQLFRSEVDALRRKGRRVCEFTKLAMDRLVRSKRVLASLFHVAYIFAHRINGYQELLIEVNPRHVLFYERMLGFEVRSEAKLNPRVDAPAVLMALDFSYGHSQIAKFGGRQDLADDERSLYPYFFAVSEEAGIVARVRRG
jgi:hypothetical protein